MCVIAGQFCEKKKTTINTYKPLQVYRHERFMNENENQCFSKSSN